MNPRLVSLFIAAVVGAWFCVGTANAERLQRLITEAELELDIALLDLDEHQTTLIRTLHDEYVDHRVSGTLGRMVREYNDAEREAIAEVADLTEAGEDPGAVAARIFGRLDQRMNRINPHLAETDKKFFNDVESLLNQQQLERMDRVRNLRVRTRLVRTNPKLPDSDVDIVSLLYSVVRAKLTPEVERFLDDFEPRFVAALRHSSNTAFAVAHHVRQAQSIGHEMRTGKHTEAERAALFEEYIDTRAKYMNPKVSACERIADLNREALAQLERILPEDQYTTLARTYYRTAYPTIFPDPALAQRIFDAALALESIEAYQRDAITALQTTYQRDHAQRSQKVVEAMDEYWRRRAIADPEERQELFEAREKIIELGMQREALSDTQVDRIRDILLPEQFAQLPDWPDDHERPWDSP